MGGPLAAEDDPQAFSVVPIPIAAIVLSIAELPTARPIEVRKSRLAMPLFFIAMFVPAIRPPTHYRLFAADATVINTNSTTGLLT
jgi:hypothetical protein